MELTPSPSVPAGKWTWATGSAYVFGARLSFESNQGRQLGTLIKHNPKSVIVMTEGGRRWSISPHLLSAVKGASVRERKRPVSTALLIPIQPISLTNASYSRAL